MRVARETCTELLREYMTKIYKEIVLRAKSNCNYREEKYNYNKG